MSAGLSFTQIAGVVACVVGDAHGRVLEEVGAGPNNSELISAAAGLAAASGKLGVLLGLGDFEIVTTRAPSQSWVVASEDEWSVAIKVNGSRPTAPVESALRDTAWFSLVEWDVNTSEIELMPVGDSSPEKSAAAQGAARAEPAVSAVSEDVGPVATESGFKSRAAPKYRQVLLRGQGEAGEFPPREAPTCPFPNASEVSGHAAAPSDALANAPIFAGDLKLLGLVDLIEFLGNARRTGSLTCAVDGRVARIHLRFGKIVSATCPPIKGLRDYLAARVLGSGALPPATGPQGAIWSQRDVAAALVKQGTASSATVRAALEEQLRDTVSELLTWSEGDFSFEPEAARASSPIELELEFDSQALLIDVLRLKDEHAVAFARRS
jgi:hypothetical protein